jgi:hypothetical protein
MTSLGTFTNTAFGGYVASGNRYEADLCIGTYNCKFITVYSGETISADNWHFNEAGTYGMLGMGPNSFIWESFIEPEVFTATYSIELGRQIFLDPTNSVQSNITFGVGGDAMYAAAGSNYIAMNSDADYTYALTDLSFGVYYTSADNNSVYQQYFYNLTTSNPVSFSVNFMGLGLPSNLYSTMVTLLEYITTDEITCSNTLDGICTLPKACSEYTAFEDYYFRFTFEGATDYMRVPLATFAFTHSNHD